jgi:hypothetical protein
MGCNTTEDRLELRTPLSTQISSRHHAMLDELNRIGMMKNAVVEQGIEMYYRKVAVAGLIAGELLPLEPSTPRADSVHS